MGTAVVVGAGIGGLAAAMGLRRRGWDVVVLERAPAFAPVGAGLTLTANGFAALDALGVGGQVRAAVRPFEEMTFRSRAGRVLARAPLPAGAPSCGVHRATLHALLAGALPDDVVRLGAEVTAVVGVSRPEVTYRTADGGATTLTADLLVGADGVRSAVRAVVDADAPAPVPVGSTAWRGVTREAAALRGPEASWGPGTEVGLVPLEDRRVYWFVSVTDDRVGPPDGGGSQAEARALVDGWYRAVLDAVDGTDPGDVVRTELVHLRPGPARFARGTVALLGDAAHAMPPYVGQGANQALEDAAVLAAVVGPDDDVPAALAAYNGRRRRRARRVAAVARQAGRAGQQVRSPALVALRDRVVAATPPALVSRGLGRVTRWDAPVVPGVHRPPRGDAADH